MTIGIKKNKRAIIWRIEGLEDTPPELVMFINPESIDSTFTPLVSETRTLGGFIQEFWGEQLTSLSASGKVAMFYDDGGITNKNARLSESYQNFVRLLNIYKNNGKDYSDTQQNPNRITSFGAVIMIYMDKEYEGFFESFNFKELAEKPFSLEYDFSFKVTRTIGDLIVSGSNFVRESR